MPKATISSFPVSGLFAINKPSGPTSMSIINEIGKLISNSRLFVEESVLKQQEDEQGAGKKKRRGRGKGKHGNVVKIGQGGTLDPLADGVLVIAVGRKATKNLSTYLEGVKEYRTTCLLGCETDSYDSEGKTVRLAPWHHVTREQVEAVLPQFRGEIEQTPPIFSALKMDGKPLYEYAREGKPLPRPIEKRKVTISELEVTSWLGSEHIFHWPEKRFTEEEQKALENTLKSVEADAKVVDQPDLLVIETGETKKASASEPVPEGQQSSDDAANNASQAAAESAVTPTAFGLRMTVSGGTYVRSIVHDLSHAVGSAGHVVTLTRSVQGKFALDPPQEDPSIKGCIPWRVFERALVDVGPRDEDGWTEWEREVLDKLEIVDDGNDK